MELEFEIDGITYFVKIEGEFEEGEPQTLDTPGYRGHCSYTSCEVLELSDELNWMPRKDMSFDLRDTLDKLVDDYIQENLSDIETKLTEKYLGYI